MIRLPKPLCALLGAWAFVAVAMVLAWPFPLRVLVFENGPTAWAQDALLVASAAVALTKGWYALAAGLFTMALDERFMGHEHLKDWLLWNAFDGSLVSMGHWGDLPMLVYPLGGLIFLRRLAPRSRWYTAAFALGAAATALDIFLEAAAAQYVEEFLELAAEALFFGALIGDTIPISEK